MLILNKKKPETGQILIYQNLQRRNFLKYAGITTGAALFFTSCKKDKSTNPVTTTDNATVNLGSGDVGIFNLAYALDQLESAFYTLVTSNSNFTTLFSSTEQSLITDIRDNELAHREFYKTALGSSAIQDLNFNFTSINFNDKKAILTAAHTFEDTGVSAYNGSGQLIADVRNLAVAGKHASVEARHAATLRDLLSAAPLNSADFAGDDIVDANGLDIVKTVPQVILTASAFIVNPLDASNLPTS